MNIVSPLDAYRQAIDQQGFTPDAAQLNAAQCLQDCFLALHDGKRRPQTQGVYLWGPVGRGKTWLMDRFYDSLSLPARRQHFHHFMRWVHMRLFQLTGTANPLRALAQELAKDVRVLCFDELFVNDIGDAIILGGLLQVMFQEGVVVVSTSNQPPEQLYENGHNRERFEPAIVAINRYMTVVTVDGGEDHRLHPGQLHQRYWVSQPGSMSALAGVFEQLSAGQPSSNEPVAFGHRRINVIRHSEKVLWCRYADVCEQPLAAMDFIDLCDRFSAILISEVPALSAKQREGKIARGTEDAVEQVAAGDRVLPQLSVHDDGVRRFIALVDECYDRRVPLYVEAQVPLEALYTEGYLSFAFRRTLSRLQEMQLERFAKL
ncbi:MULTISPECIES: cell division protein ZapE [unclassified Pseudomonas]|uniref:cell division protein ZapE n=1 Tax=unclassified Pseudomonas TaxID=196821 RepID=UPI002AC90E39|nr:MULTISPECIES: cell division protein ZapE [unclassified Pseudomonas]MEB0040114.1 cell division protein ZapE [Pseudomonas sp. MH10]MEB0123912.1 cell division protein ZapE [Pseudomonas sp. CCI1.2]WPX65452.1 cell division protein ZapE [Pseudomonas sp. MH10]